MTAVEWLVNEINKINVSPEARRFISKLEKQAKEMEKQQQDKFAIGFAEWLVIRYNEDIIYDEYSTQELLEIYKKKDYEKQKHLAFANRQTK